MITFNDEQEIWVKLLILGGVDRLIGSSDLPEDQYFKNRWSDYADIVRVESSKLDGLSDDKVMQIIDKVLRTAIFKE